MTTQQIFNKVRFIGQYAENDATDSQLFDLLNNAITDELKMVLTVREDFLLKEGTAQDLVADQSDYTLATDILQIKQIQVALDGSNFYVAYRKNLNEADDLINTTTESQSEPKYITITQTDSTEFIIRLQPTPSEAVTDGLKYWHIQRPADISSLVTVPVIPLELHPVLVQRMLQELKQRDADSVGMRLAAGEAERLRISWKGSISERNIDRWEGFYQRPFEE